MVCIHPSGEEVKLGLATDVQGMGYSDDEVALEHDRLNEFLENKGVTDFTITRG